MRRVSKVRYNTYKIESINADKGNNINDLEAFIHLVQSLIRNKQKDGKKGIVLFKGTPSETKMSYKKAQGVLCALEAQYGMYGCFSFGICADCDEFNSDAFSGKNFGKCKGKMVHAFDGCESHSNGGFGL